MVSAPTLRANALAIPLSHRDDDALDATLAARLFETDRSVRRARSIPAPLLERLASTDGRKRRGALADLDLYDRLGQRVYDDGFAVVSMRQLSKERTDNPDKERTVTSRRLRRLAAEGSIEAHAWPWQHAKATAYRLPVFAAWLHLDRRLREPRAEIAALLEAKTSVDGAQQTSVDGAQQTSVDTSSVLDSVDKTQGPAARFHGKIAPDRSKNRPRSTPKPARPAAAKEVPQREDGERIYAEVNMRAAMTPASFERLMAANKDLERRRAEAVHLDAVRLDYKIDLLSRGLVGLTAGG